MGYEYAAPVVLTAQQIDVLLDRLLHDGRYELLASRADRVMLRFRENPARLSWPEDVEIAFDGELCVVFHGWQGSQRDELLALLASAVASMGHACEIEEK